MVYCEDCYAVYEKQGAASQHLQNVFDWLFFYDIMFSTTMPKASLRDPYYSLFQEESENMFCWLIPQMEIFSLLKGGYSF